ncbi:MAG TPA: hypothetical protein DCR58_08835, partial [Idiomarina baltica]|nr:hypothetical protein [Idiomarina baltica]
MDKNLWRWIELNEYETPSVPTTMLAKRWWQKMLQTLRPSRVEVSTANSAEEEPKGVEFKFDEQPLLDSLNTLLDQQNQDDPRVTWLVLAPA